MGCRSWWCWWGSCGLGAGDAVGTVRYGLWRWDVSWGWDEYHWGVARRVRIGAINLGTIWDHFMRAVIAMVESLGVTVLGWGSLERGGGHGFGVRVIGEAWGHGFGVGVIAEGCGHGFGVRVIEEGWRSRVGSEGHWRRVGVTGWGWGSLEKGGGNGWEWGSLCG